MNTKILRDLHDFYKFSVTLWVQNIATPPFLRRYIGKKLIGEVCGWSRIQLVVVVLVQLVEGNICAKSTDTS